MSHYSFILGIIVYWQRTVYDNVEMSRNGQNLSSEPILPTIFPQNNLQTLKFYFRVHLPSSVDLLFVKVCLILCSMFQISLVSDIGQVHGLTLKCTWFKILFHYWTHYYGASSMLVAIVDRTDQKQSLFSIIDCGCSIFYYTHDTHDEIIANIIRNASVAIY